MNGNVVQRIAMSAETRMDTVAPSQTNSMLISGGIETAMFRGSGGGFGGGFGGGAATRGLMADLSRWQTRRTPRARCARAPTQPPATMFAGGLSLLRA